MNFVPRARNLNNIYTTGREYFDKIWIIVMLFLFFLERDPAQVERTNLVNLCKLIVKELIDSSVKYGRQLDSDFVPLQHFFIVLEHALRHGLRPKKVNIKFIECCHHPFLYIIILQGLLGPKKELWDLLQTIEKSNTEAGDITASVRDLPTAKYYI